MLLVDMVEGRIVDDQELKTAAATKRNFRSWIDGNVMKVGMLVLPTLPLRQGKPADSLSRLLSTASRDSTKGCENHRPRNEG